MSEIYFIRHGQASFGEENYDRLSPRGIKQAQCLAKRLARAGKSSVYFRGAHRRGGSGGTRFVR